MTASSHIWETPCKQTYFISPTPFVQLFERNTEHTLRFPLYSVILLGIMSHSFDVDIIDIPQSVTQYVGSPIDVVN